MALVEASLAADGSATLQDVPFLGTSVCAITLPPPPPPLSESGVSVSENLAAVLTYGFHCNPCLGFRRPCQRVSACVRVQTCVCVSVSVFLQISQCKFSMVEIWLASRLVVTGNHAHGHMHTSLVYSMCVQWVVLDMRFGFTKSTDQQAVTLGPGASSSPKLTAAPETMAAAAALVDGVRRRLLIQARKCLDDTSTHRKYRPRIHRLDVRNDHTPPLCCNPKHPLLALCGTTTDRGAEKASIRKEPSKLSEQ